MALASCEVMVRSFRFWRHVQKRSVSESQSSPHDEVPGPCVPYVERWSPGEPLDGVPRLYAQVTDPGAGRVLNHMCVHGHVTVAVLRETYGYHDPMEPFRVIAAATIPFETCVVTGRDGVSAKAWRLSDPSLAVIDLHHAPPS